MLLSLAAIVAASQSSQPAFRPSGVTAEARATVRIVRGERVTFAEQQQSGRLRETLVRSADGSVERARVIDFQ